MKGLADDNVVAVAEDFVGTQDAVERAQAGVVGLNALRRHARIDEVIAHLRRFVISEGAVVAADDEVLRLAAPVQFGGGIDAGAVVEVDATVSSVFGGAEDNGERAGGEGVDVVIQIRTATHGYPRVTQRRNEDSNGE